jgi:hypothetical protein
MLSLWRGVIVIAFFCLFIRELSAIIDEVGAIELRTTTSTVGNYINY